MQQFGGKVQARCRGGGSNLVAGVCVDGLVALLVEFAQGRIGLAGTLDVRGQGHLADPVGQLDDVAGALQRKAHEPLAGRFHFKDFGGVAGTGKTGARRELLTGFEQAPEAVLVGVGVQQQALDRAAGGSLAAQPGP